VIDLHCHILPGIDDGATDLADSIAMARQAAADGITTVCATPHIHPRHDVLVAELPDRVAALNAELRANATPVTIVTGGEVSAGLAGQLDDHELHAVSLGGAGRWILLEPEPGPLDDRFDTAVELLARRGHRSVIAHPERHVGPDWADRLARLVTDARALVQITAELIASGPAAPALLQLAQAGLVHLVASDAHSARAGRPVAISAGLRALGTIERLRPHLRWIGNDAAAAILRGDDVAPPFAALPRAYPAPAST
jgi:protein-tyrosine phosphatase